MTLKLRFWDKDGDGVVTAVEIFTILRIGVYLACGTWACFHPKDYTDIKYIGTIAASFGAGMFEIFLMKWKGKDEANKANSNTLYRDIAEGEN